VAKGSRWREENRAEPVGPTVAVLSLCSQPKAVARAGKKEKVPVPADTIQPM
jgi:hypothetical protein